MAVTANQLIVRQDEYRKSYPVEESTRIYEGTLVFVNSNGYADDDTGSGVNKFAGVSIREVDNSSGADGAMNCEVWTEGVFELTGSGFTQADVGKNAFATDNYAMVVADAATAVRIGVVAGYVSATKLMVRIDTYKSHQAAALTAALTALTHTAPDADDFAIQGITSSTPFGFVSANEGNTVLKVLANLQSRSAEMEAILQANGLVD